MLVESCRRMGDWDRLSVETQMLLVLLPAVAQPSAFPVRLTCHGIIIACSTFIFMTARIAPSSAIIIIIVIRPILLLTSFRHHHHHHGILCHFHQELVPYTTGRQTVDPGGAAKEGLTLQPRDVRVLAGKPKGSGPSSSNCAKQELTVQGHNPLLMMLT